MGFFGKLFHEKLRCFRSNLFQPITKTRKPIAYFRRLSSNTRDASEEEELCSTFLRECARKSDSRWGRTVHAKLIKGFIPFSMYLQNFTLNMYVKGGKVDDGLRLFDEMPHRNVVSFSALIAGLVQWGFPGEALSIFNFMHRDGTVGMNEFTLVSALQACSLISCRSFCYQIYALIVRLGLECNVYLVNAFLTGLIRQGKFKEALEVFEKCNNKDTVSWNTMLAGHLQDPYLDLPGFWYRMICCEEVKPDNFTFASVLTGLAVIPDLKMGLQVHGQLLKSGYGSEKCVGNSLADMYIKNQRLVEGFKVFDEMMWRDVCSWTLIAAGCLQCGEPGRALEVIGEMREMGVKPNKFTLATALNACANLASMEEGKKVHGLKVKLGNEVDLCVDNALLDMYAKCGCMEGAWIIFRSMRTRSVVTWTTMIMACAQNGQARDAIEVFEEMRMEDVEPNNITFICVLYACSQGGFVEKGRYYFSSMSSDYGISPTEDHYVCMVNLLGRAGHIKDAEELILSMPFQAGVLAWQTLLGACQLHGDVETGKRAAEHAIDLDKKDPSTYVLLSNMLAVSNNWDKVGVLRELMETRDVQKTPGSSWI
ncbi:pentatricopeptide repeat-containing protein At2g13600-like [Tripterygium wilfordii]|uniref:pentatricopeptide repeat-containing protein At2g13600-like n=1 Tax=Tripterygium wilfordii TaxID=458696 RepID=UPI0018F843E5|nr:pentatricopeptide repeat-containing protein At2g13600-like [Tripterygium wilfordii]